MENYVQAQQNQPPAEVNDAQIVNEIVPIESYARIDFTQKWELSDVAIVCQDQKELFVNRSIMAIHSPYFKALFYKDFMEKDKESISVPIDFWYLHKILRIIHFQEKINIANPDNLVKMYRVADQYDFPIIRRMCVEDLLKMEPNKGYEASVQLGLDRLKSRFLHKMSSEDIQNFVQNQPDTLFTSSDVAAFLKRSREVEQTRKRPYIDNQIATYMEQIFFPHLAYLQQQGQLVQMPNINQFHHLNPAPAQQQQQQQQIQQ